MSDSPEQIEIEIEDKKPELKEGDVEIVKAEEAPAKEPVKEIDPEEGLKNLKEQLERERSARIEAEKKAREFAEREFRAKTEVQDTNLSLVTNAIDQVRQNAEILKASYREAMSINDYDRAAEIQASMATNAAKLLQLEQGKEALEKAPKPSGPERIEHSDPVERFASQLSPRSADWVRRNPQFVTDQRLNQKMIAAHNLALADGHTPDTEDYFQAIEETLKVRKPEMKVEADNPMSDAAKPMQKRSAPPAAPVSRSGNGTGSRPNVVRLTAAEREIAEMMGMTDQEYAKNKLALQKEGKLN